jgi:hypothetical protein
VYIIGVLNRSSTEISFRLSNASSISNEGLERLDSKVGLPNLKILWKN